MVWSEQSGELVLVGFDAPAFNLQMTEDLDGGYTKGGGSSLLLTGYFSISSTSERSLLLNYRSTFITMEVSFVPHRIVGRSWVMSVQVAQYKMLFSTFSSLLPRML